MYSSLVYSFVSLRVQLRAPEGARGWRGRNARAAPFWARAYVQWWRLGGVRGGSKGEGKVGKYPAGRAGAR